LPYFFIHYGNRSLEVWHRVCFSLASTFGVSTVSHSFKPTRAAWKVGLSLVRQPKLFDQYPSQQRSNQPRSFLHLLHKWRQGAGIARSRNKKGPVGTRKTLHSVSRLSQLWDNAKFWGNGGWHWNGHGVTNCAIVTPQLKDRAKPGQRIGQTSMADALWQMKLMKIVTPHIGYWCTEEKGDLQFCRRCKNRKERVLRKYVICRK